MYATVCVDADYFTSSKAKPVLAELLLGYTLELLSFNVVSLVL